MTKARWEHVVELLDTTFNLLLVAFTLVLLTNKFSHGSIALYVNLHYFIAIIAILGFSSILMRVRSRERQDEAPPPQGDASPA